MRRDLAKYFLIGLAYFLLSQLGIGLANLNHNIAPVWPASAIAIGVIYCFGLRFWPAIWVSSFIAHLLIHLPLLASAGNATGSVLESISAVLLLRYLLSREQFSYQTEAVAYAVTALLATTLSATVGTFFLFLNGPSSKEDLFQFWLTRWSGNALGALIGVPIVISICGKTFFKTLNIEPRSRVWFESFLIFLATAGFSYFIFFTDQGDLYLFGLFFLLLWAGFRSHGDLQLVLSFLMANMGIFGTSLGKGPFQDGTVSQNIVFLQLFLGAVGITALSIRGFKKVSSMRSAGVTLVIGWIFTWLLFLSFHQRDAFEDEAHFRSLTTDMQNSLKRRVSTYEMALRAGAGFMSSVAHPTREKWKTFSDNLDLPNLESGMSGLGVVYKVEKRDLARFTLEQQRRGDREFRINPLPGFEIPFKNNTDHYVVLFLESDEINKRAIGLDIGSEPLRRETANLAKKLGRPVMSSKITLYYLKKKQPGFLFIMPFNDGWVFAPFVISEFFEGILGRYSAEIAFELFDDSAAIKEPFYASIRNRARKGKFDQETVIELGQRKFRVGWYKQEGFVSSHDTTNAWVSASGAFMVVLLASLIVGLQSLTSQANLIADERTKKLRQTEYFLQTILDHLPVALFCKNVKDGYRFSVWNKMSEGLFGLKKSQILGKTDYDFFPREQSDSFRKIDEETMEDAAVVDIPEESVTSPNEGIKTVHTIKVPIFDRDGNPDVLLGISLDITELKESQRVLELQRAKLVSSSKMSTLGEMASGIAHEINNPLAIISGTTYRMKKTAEFISEEREKASYLNALGKIDQTVARISKIVRGLKSFSRNADKDPFERVSLSSIISDTLEFCSEKFKHHAVDLKVSIASEVILKCRAAQISEVVLNLITNAFDAVLETPNSWVEIASHFEGDFVVISVTDSGKGIPVEIQDKIMDPFFTTKEVGKGTGLGLSISKGIIEDHGGKLVLDTTSPHTRFLIYLPKVES